ncbi:MAG: DUF454 family protein [Agathobacter sp.]|nr:DUF454 family protein [Agathobacter sp.]
MKRIIWIFLFIIFFILGCIGLVLPIIPQVPFLIGSLYCLSKVSVRVHRIIEKSLFYRKYHGTVIEWVAKIKSGIKGIKYKLFSKEDNYE